MSMAAGVDSVPPKRRRTRPVLLGATVAVFVVVAALAVASWVMLRSQSADDPWVPVMQDVLKTAYQALALGALGGMAKLFLDRRREAEAARAALRDRQRGYMAAVVSASHSVENARLLVISDRSAATWRKQINEVIVPARTSLRSVSHDLVNWQEAGEAVFKATDDIVDGIRHMADYLFGLIDEKAEAGEPGWAELQRLELLGDLIDFGPRFAMFRDQYLHALGQMRRELR